MKVIVYSSPNCLQSKNLKKYLVSRGITFVDKDITASESNFLEFEKYDPVTSPLCVLIDENGEEFVHEGFNDDVKTILDMLL
jgi:glutaredoxin